ncbi:MAG: 30S ribosomal protein S9, partial [Patescibacteria group bacterium]
MEKETKTTELKGKYLNAVGRRKSAVAQIRLYKNGDGKMVANGIDLKKYFPIPSYFDSIIKPLKLTGLENKVDLS